MLIGGHGEQWKTVELVTRNFWWPRVTKEVKWYVERYNACQYNKNCTEQLAEKLMLNSISEKSWMHISVDFITKLPLAQGYDSILVVVNRLTKMVYFIPTMEKMLAKGLTRLFRNNVWKLHRLLESIILDRGPQFAVGLMWELNRILGIKSKLLTAFYPQTDEQCHKLHLVISPPILRRFPRSQSKLKALKKTFRSMPVTSRGDQYWPRY